MENSWVPYMKVIGRSELFYGIAIVDLERLPSVTRIEDVSQGTNILKEGELVRGLCLLLDGTVSVLKNGRPVATLEKGNFFGEISLFGDSITATATVQAGAGCKLLTLPRAALEMWLGEHLEAQAGFYRNLATELCKRLHATTDRF